MDDYSFSKLYNDNNLGKDKQRLIRSLFAKVKKLHVENNAQFIFGGITSYLCGWAYSNKKILVSIVTDAKFNTAFLAGLIDPGVPVDLPNLGNRTHIKEHLLLLDIRVYEPNPKHKLGRNWGSPMDLDINTAQTVLDDAIMYDGSMKSLVNIHNAHLICPETAHEICQK